MLLELVGVDDVNKGGELMMRAILDRLDDEAQFAIGHWGGSYSKRARLGLYQKVWIRRLGRFGGLLGQAMPSTFRAKYGLVTDDDVDAFLDASGFGYSDQWGVSQTEVAAALTRARRRAGKTTILLPQAFGPFATPRSRAAAASLVRNADLVFARERVSYDHLVNLVGELPHIRMCPDFTTALSTPPRPDLLPVASGLACALIPNYRMVDMGGSSSEDAYIGFLTKCVRRVAQAGLSPFFLIHETDRDAEIAQRVIERHQQSIPIFTHDDPLAIKGVIAASELVIGSRFHGLVSALAQGVPALGSGWSHKYRLLFEDYGVYPELLVEHIEDLEELDGKLSKLLDPRVREHLKRRIRSAGENLERAVEDMWEHVRHALGLTIHSTP